MLHFIYVEAEFHKVLSEEEISIKDEALKNITLLQNLKSFDPNPNMYNLYIQLNKKLDSVGN